MLIAATACKIWRCKGTTYFSHLQVFTLFFKAFGGKFLRRLAENRWGVWRIYFNLRNVVWGKKYANLKKKHFGIMGSWVGVLSVVSRSSLGKMRQGIREVKEAAILKNGNYIWVDTTTSDDKNYLNQQPKQLVSTTFRGPTPSAARKKTMHGVNRYINP